MPRIGAERLASRRSDLVAAARAVFTANGYEQTKMGEIARAAGVSDGLAYRYFASKRELLQGVLDEFYGRIIAHNEACVAQETDLVGKLTTLIREHVRLLLEDPGMFRLFISEVRSLDDYAGSRTHELNRRYTSMLTDIVENGKKAGIIDPSTDARLVRDMVFGGIEHLAWRHFLADQPVDVEAIATNMTRLLLAGLTCRQDA